MFESIGQHAQGQGLDLGDRFFSTLAIYHDARQGRYFGDPSAVFFALDLDIHCVQPYSRFVGVTIHASPFTAEEARSRVRHGGYSMVAMD
jgi:hypothetical protein